MPDLSTRAHRVGGPGHDPAVDGATLDRVLDAVARMHAMPWADYRRRPPTGTGRGVPCPSACSCCPGRPPRAIGPRGCGRRPVPGRLGRLRPARAGGRARPVERLVGGSCAAARRARPAAERPACTATSSSPTSRRSTTAGWRYRLADDVAGARWRSSSAGSSSRTARACAGRPRRSWPATTRPPSVPAAASLPMGRSWLSGPSVGPATERDPDRPAAARPRCHDRRLGRAGRPDLDHRAAAARLAQGLDAEAGAVLPSGVSAADDLAWWSARAVEAAARRL